LCNAGATRYAAEARGELEGNRRRWGMFLAVRSTVSQSAAVSSLRREICQQ